MTKVNLTTKKFGTPIVRVGRNGTPQKPRVTDEDIDRYMNQRKDRQLNEAKLADLTVATEESKLQATRLRNERDKAARGENTTEEGMDETTRKVEQAADVAASAVNAGVAPQDAKDLATGKRPVVIVTTGPKKEGASTGEEKGGWSVAGGKPVKDPDGEYTFTQALKVAEIQNKPGGGGNMEVLNWLKDNGLLGGGRSDSLTQKVMDDFAQKAVDSYLSGVGGGGKGASEEVLALKGEIQQLRTMVSELADPVKIMEKAKHIREELVSLGVVGGNGSSGTGEPRKSIEEIREENRHAEKKEELSIEKEYKNKLGDSVGNLLELSGRGAAHEVIENRKRSGSAEAPAVGDNTTFDEIECPTCKKDGVTTKIPILPETVDVTCPRCGSIFHRNK